MPTPHVATLRYRVEPAEGMAFSNSMLPVTHQEDLFSLKLEGGLLILEMKKHFGSISQAKDAVAPFFQRWEVDVYLRSRRKELEFIFDSADVVDLDPPVDGTKVIFLEAAIASSSDVSATLTISLSKYPAPPVHFRLTPLAETMWNRYRRSLAGDEPLLAMAYFCLTALEQDAGSRKSAADRFNVSSTVLDKLGRLTAKGDETEARKITESSPDPLSQSDRDWIDAAIRILIRRAGELGDTNALPKIEMGDLPPLK